MRRWTRLDSTTRGRTSRRFGGGSTGSTAGRDDGSGYCGGEGFGSRGDEKTLRVVGGAHAICGTVWSPNGDNLHFTDMNDGKIREFKVSSGEVIGTIPVAERLCGLDFARTPNGRGTRMRSLLRRMGAERM